MTVTHQKLAAAANLRTCEPRQCSTPPAGEARQALFLKNLRFPFHFHLHLHRADVDLGISCSESALLLTADANTSSHFPFWCKVGVGVGVGVGGFVIVIVYEPHSTRDTACFTLKPSDCCQPAAAHFSPLAEQSCQPRGIVN